jgi:hypothetical protein
MRPASCPQEGNVLKAVRTGIWEEALSAHLDGCAVCKEIAHASRWMQALAQGSESIRTLPDPSRVWWRAQLSEKQMKAERAQELLEWVEIISATVFSAGIAGWIGWNWHTIQSLFTSLLADAWTHSWITASSALSTAPMMFSSGAVILSIVAIVLAFPVLVRD